MGATQLRERYNVGWTVFIHLVKKKQQNRNFFALDLINMCESVLSTQNFIIKNQYFFNKYVGV